MFIHESGTTDRPTILFLHGNGANGTMWKAHVERLNDYHCLAPDFPGYGRSNDREWVSLDETTRLVVGMIRDRAVHARAHVVGLSLGGSVILTLLSQAPEVVDHAITRSFLEANRLRQPPGLDEVARPVLFVAGEKEPDPVQRSGVRLSETMPNAQSRVAPGMGHGWLAEAPDLHIRMVQAWIVDQPLPQELQAG